MHQGEVFRGPCIFMRPRHVGVAGSAYHAYAREGISMGSAVLRDLGLILDSAASHQ